MTDPHSATNADTDAALALLLAGRRWADPTLLEAGRRMVSTIWARDVATVAGCPYVTAGDWAMTDTIVAVNPGYFSPYAYRIFAEVDPEHDWMGALDAGYRLLFDASQAPLGAAHSAGLPPDWVGVERADGALIPLPLPASDTTRYSDDAARTYWRVALDLRWNRDGRAEAYLRQAGFLRDEVNRKGWVSAAYARDGTIGEEKPSVVGTTGAFAALLTLDPEVAQILYANQLVGGAIHTGARAYWGDPADLNAQAWGWFAVALYADALPNLWHTPPGR